MCLFSKFSNLDDISSHRVTLLYDLFNVYKNYILETVAPTIHFHSLFISTKYECETSFTVVSPAPSRYSRQTLKRWRRITPIVSIIETGWRASVPLP